MKIIETKNYEELSEESCSYMLERLENIKNLF